MADLAWLQTQFGDLRNLEALKPSGQKEVFKAEHRTHGPVMLKLFKHQPGPKVQQRIVREIETPNKIRSPRVPQIHGTGQINSPAGEIAWLIEKKIEGIGLDELIKKSGKIDPRSVIKIGLHVLEVLSAAESVKIVHRDPGL